MPGSTKHLLALAMLIAFPPAEASAQSNSNASNFDSGAQLSVNGRTGALTLSAPLFHIPGRVHGMDATLSLTFRSDAAQSDAENQISYFGLPYGWSYGLSFLRNDGETLQLHVDGQQSYIVDGNWQTNFTPTGETDPISAKTGLKQYNRMDANFRVASGSQSINGATVGYVFDMLDGQAQYFSTQGLLLRHADRFGNHIDYLYDKMSGDPTEVKLDAIIDTWGSKITIADCAGAQCHLTGEIVVTLPDGRTVSWVSEDDYTVSYLIDTQGKVTHLGWKESPADHGEWVLTMMTTPSGGMTTAVWDTLPVCTQRATTNSCAEDGNTTTWPVVSTLYQCPNNKSGTACPLGSSEDFLTTSYVYQTSNGEQNYTGYPLYSPYVPQNPSGQTDTTADALMISNDTAYVYTTTTATKTAGGAEINSVVSDYNFLHLLTEREVLVRARNAQNQWAMTLSKVTSYCHELSGQDASASCPMTNADYQLLPANYQSPTRIGSCQFNVGPTASQDKGRRSLVTTTFDSFGLATNKRKYHGTAESGIADSCDSREGRLGVGTLELVTDQYIAYDVPSGLDSDQYLKLGPGASHFGLPIGQQSFIYLDPDENGVEIHGQLAATSDPIMVKLLCNVLTSDANNIHTSTVGLVGTKSAPPQTPGEVADCKATKPWTDQVAPPKTSTMSYDQYGRGTGHATTWASGYTAPSGVAGTSNTTSYTMSKATSAEEACGVATDANVLEIVATALADPGEPTAKLGNVAQQHRVCTLNGFHLSSSEPYDPANTDPAPTTYYAHYLDGLTKKTTQPNGTGTEVAYYYACPVAQDGRTETCPSYSTIVKTGCPYEAGKGHNCVVETLNAGQGNKSYVDGVVSVVVRDGMGRIIAHADDTGGTSGQGYTAAQTRSTATYDSVGMVTSKTSEIGASNPLIYETSVTYGPKLRPDLICGPRGTANQFVRDDVYQQTKTIINGADKETYTLNDSRKMTLLVSCPITENSTAPGSGACPTVAKSTSATSCSGGYHSYTLHDGSGVPYSVQASVGESTETLGSIKSVTGQSTVTIDGTLVSAYSADLMQYGYDYSSTPNGNTGTVTAKTSFDRNVLGHKRRQQLSVTAGAGTNNVVSDLFAYNALADQQSETNRMSSQSVTLEKQFTYTPAGRMETYRSYAGVTFHNYYDNMHRMVRHCYPGENGGSQGENITSDPITGKTIKIARFTNPAACKADSSGDEEGIWQAYSYNRFGGIDSVTYSDGVKLVWAYDTYQRPTCFADVMATEAGYSCPASPTVSDYTAAASTMLIYRQYYADTDPYRRGLLERTCRGVPDGNGGHVTNCLEFDYYTPVTAGGMCKDGQIKTDGSCTNGEASVTGAFPGMMKSEAYYTGGPSNGGGTLVYKTEHSYDVHRRPASVVTTNAAGQIVLASTYAYDQFDNLTREASLSQLDSSAASNYQIAYGYDGMLRLTSADRKDLDGGLIKMITYEYDAASNLTKKVEVTPDTAE